MRKGKTVEIKRITCHNDNAVGLLEELMRHKEREQTVVSLVTRVADSLRKETVKPLID